MIFITVNWVGLVLIMNVITRRPRSKLFTSSAKQFVVQLAMSSPVTVFEAITAYLDDVRVLSFTARSRTLCVYRSVVEWFINPRSL